MVFDDCPAEPLSALCTRPTSKPRRISLTSRKTVPAGGGLAAFVGTIATPTLLCTACWSTIRLPISIPA